MLAVTFQWDKVSLACFFSSYLVALGFEAAQLLKKHAASHWLALVFAGAGLIAQTIYLIVRSRTAGMPPLLSSTHDWLLVLAWLLVLLYLFVELIDRNVSLGIFTLPAVLILVGVSRFVSDIPNPALGRLRGLGMFHAAMLVLGMAGVFVGFVMSMMYLVQHRRLKHKRGEPGGLHLLSLETLSRVNWWSVILSAPLLTIGMGTGVWLTFLSTGTDTPVDLGRWQFVVSGIVWLAISALFVWLLAVRRASGKVVAWRTMWACGFLIATLMLLQIFSGGGIHGTG